MTSASEQTSASLDWLERAFDAGCNHFAYHESNRTEYSPDFAEWYNWYKDQFEGQPDELSKEAEHWKKRWEIQCEAVDVAQTSVTNLHFELSKAQEQERWKEIAVDGLPGEGDESDQFLLFNAERRHVFAMRQRKYIHSYRVLTTSAYTHWRPIDLP